MDIRLTGTPEETTAAAAVTPGSAASTSWSTRHPS